MSVFMIRRVYLSTHTSKLVHRWVSSSFGNETISCDAHYISLEFTDDPLTCIPCLAREIHSDSLEAQARQHAAGRDARRAERLRKAKP